ncbi:MAG: HNH endonuclease, partial [Desulfovibrio sp.]|nr:HNH endonuclease [Desulfovibrio sp.]
MSEGNIHTNPSSHRGTEAERMMRARASERTVLVVNRDGKALDPTTSARANAMIRDGKATVLRRCPFTIKLTHQARSCTSNLAACIDIGSTHVGAAVVDIDRRQTLHQQETMQRTDIKMKMDRRRDCRGKRRCRKTRSREARFLNRAASIREGRLPPTLQPKLWGVVCVIRNLCKWYPIKHVVIEGTKFDIHRLVNPDVEGEGYRLGPKFGYRNVTECVLDRDGHECRQCGAKSTSRNGLRLEVHHVIPRSRRGPTIPGNLVTLCAKCHKDVTDG